MRKRREKSSWISVLQEAAPTTIVGVLLLGFIGSMIYDVLVRPSLSDIGRHALNFVTFGSEIIRDIAYESAAADPQPATPLFILIGLFAVVITMGVVFTPVLVFLLRGG